MNESLKISLIFIPAAIIVAAIAVLAYDEKLYDAENTQNIILISAIISLLSLIAGAVLLIFKNKEKQKLYGNLKRNVKLYNTFLKNFPNGAVFVFDNEEKFVIAEGNSLASAALTKESIESKKINEVYTAEEYNLVKPHIEQALKGNRSFTINEFRGRWFSSSFLPIVSDKGTVSGGISISHDISEQREAFNKLKNVESLYKTILKQFPRGVISLHDKDLKYIIADGKGLRLFNKKAEEISGSKIADVIGELHFAKLERYYKGVLEGNHYEFDYIYNGRLLHFIFEPVEETGADRISCGLVISYDVTEEKTYQRELQSSEKLYKTLVKNLPDVTVTIYNDELKYLLAEGGGFTKMQFDPKKLEGKNIKDVMKPDAYFIFEEYYKAPFRGETVKMEYEQNNRNLVITFLPLIDDSESKKAMVITEDITERKNAEKEIKKREQLYQYILKNLPNATVSLFDKDHKIILSEGMGYDELKITSDQIVGKKIEDIIPDDQVNKLSEAYDNAFKGESTTFELKFEDQHMIATIRPYVNEQGKIEYGMAIAQNITKLKNETETRTRLEALYKTILENFPNGIVSIYDKELNILTADGEALEDFGLTKEMLVNKNLKEMLPDEDKEFAKNYDIVFENKKHTFTTEVNGKIAEITNVPIKGENNQIKFGISIALNVTEKHKQQEEIKEQQLLYKTMMDNFPNGTISLFNRDLIRTMIGGTELTKEGINKEYVLRKHIKELLPDTGYEPYVKHYENVFEGRMHTMEVPFDEKTYLITVIPIRNNKGEIFSGMSISQNITHIKDFEKKVTQSRDFYLTLFENFPSMIWRTDIDGNADYLNNTWLKFTGKTLAESLGSGWAESIYYDDKNTVLENFHKAFKDRENFNIEFRLLRYDDECRWVTLYSSPYTDLSKEFCGYICVCYDIHQRKVSEENLIQNEAMLRDAQAAAHIGSWEWDLKTQKLQWSEELYRIFGLDPMEEEITYEKYISLLDPEHKEEMLTTIENSLKTGSKYDIEHFIIRPDGTKRLLHGQGKIIFDDNSIPIKMSGIAHDITDKREAETKLREAERRISHNEKLAALGRFSSHISHEVRNPLANISASSQLMLNKFKPEPPMSTYLEIILRNAQTASRIIKELLSFSSPREIALDSGNISEVVNDVAELISGRCQAADIKLNVSTDEGKDIKILMNREKLQEALLNFASNAIDAMPNGGNLDLILKNEFHYLSICIIDTGVGIKKENLEKIFEPFFTTKEQGTGLGTALANQIIQNHNGKIHIESEVNKGTKITIKLPFKEEKQN